MATKSEAYVDTAALIALCDRSDTYHALFRRLFSDPPALVTTALVIGEGHAWFAKRFDATRGLRFLAMIEAMKPLRTVVVGRRGRTWHGRKGCLGESRRDLPDRREHATDRQPATSVRAAH